MALIEALGYPYDRQLRYLRQGEPIPLLAALARDGGEYLWIVETPFAGEDDSPLDQLPVWEQYRGLDDVDAEDIPQEPWEELVGEIFRVDEPPRWVIFLGGRSAYLMDRTKWGYGQYLMFDLDDLFGRMERDAIKATAALLARDALAPDDGPPLHETLDENSHKHAYAVSSDLKYGVRRAVELLANEYVWYQRSVAKQALFQDEDWPASSPPRPSPGSIASSSSSMPKPAGASWRSSP